MYSYEVETRYTKSMKGKLRKLKYELSEHGKKKRHEYYENVVKPRLAKQKN